MYLKLRYRARLANPAQIERLSDEVEDICRSNAWACRRWEEDWSKPNTIRFEMDETAIRAEGHAPLRGITFAPHPDSETVWLTFTPDGILQSLHTLQDPTFTGDDAGYPWNRVKTGFDGTKTHLAICHLFRFLEKRYFGDLQVLDESGYWEHGDPARFDTWMAQCSRDFKMLEEELDALEADETLDPEKRAEIAHQLFLQYGKNLRPDHD